MTEHPQAELLRAIADGRQVQTSHSDGDWKDAHWDSALALLVARQDNRVRIKPAVIVINGVEVPEPEREVPPMGAQYWLVDVTNDGALLSTWDGGDIDKRWLSAGLIHLSRDAAEVHHRALILASGGQP